MSTVFSQDRQFEWCVRPIIQIYRCCAEDDLKYFQCHYFSWTPNDLLEKASSQLDDARKTETADLHNFQMLKQSLVDEIKYANKELEEAKKGIAENGEKKAVTEDGLDRTLDSGTLQANPYCKWPFCEKGDCQ